MDVAAIGVEGSLRSQPGSIEFSRELAQHANRGHHPRAIDFMDVDRVPQISQHREGQASTEVLTKLLKPRQQPLDRLQTIVPQR